LEFGAAFFGSSSATFPVGKAALRVQSIAHFLIDQYLPPNVFIDFPIERWIYIEGRGG
jgi:hypothetical protein